MICFSSGFTYTFLKFQLGGVLYRVAQAKILLPEHVWADTRVRRRAIAKAAGPD